MTHVSRQSALVGLTAGVLLAAAGAYAISLNRIAQPSVRDLPLITISQAAAASPPSATSTPTPATGATRTTTPPAAPTAAEPPATSAPGSSDQREVVTPKIREEDSEEHDGHSSGVNPSSGESFQQNDPADDD